MSDETRPGAAGRRKPRLLDRVRQSIRARHYSPRTEKAYVYWIKQFIFFHRKRHPKELGADEIRAFLNDLAVARKVSASTQNQARNALLFLYKNVLDLELEWLEDVVRAKGPRRLPVVLSQAEVAELLRHLHGTPWLIAATMYGSGMRLLECCRLRVKDVDFHQHQLVVRNGKGQKDRTTLFPAKLTQPLAAHLERVKRQHERDLRIGAGAVELPFALARKYPGAATHWGWQWVFPATRHYLDRDSGLRRRHHLHESVVQKAIREAVRIAGIPKPASSHSLRHSFATPSPRSRSRHPYRPRATRPQRRQDDPDLHPRPRPRPLAVRSPLDDIDDE